MGLPSILVGAPCILNFCLSKSSHLTQDIPDTDTHEYEPTPRNAGESERADEVMYVESSGVWVRWLDFERQKISIHGSPSKIEARPEVSQDPDLA